MSYVIQPIHLPWSGSSLSSRSVLLRRSAQWRALIGPRCRLKPGAASSPPIWATIAHAGIAPIAGGVDPRVPLRGGSALRPSRSSSRISPFPESGHVRPSGRSGRRLPWPRCRVLPGTCQGRGGSVLRVLQDAAMDDRIVGTRQVASRSVAPQMSLRSPRLT
jgi:hypothetical protein